MHGGVAKVFQPVSLVQVTFTTGFALPTVLVKLSHSSCDQLPITSYTDTNYTLTNTQTHTHQHQHMVQVTFNTGSHSACDQLPTTTYIDTNYTLTNTHTHTLTHTHTPTQTHGSRSHWFKLPLPLDLLIPTFAVSVFYQTPPNPLDGLT